jgi:hypothetical protein
VHALAWVFQLFDRACGAWEGQSTQLWALGHLCWGGECALYMFD